MTEKRESSDNVYEKARQAVEQFLILSGHEGDFIDKQWDKIETRLLDVETRAANAEKKSPGQSANLMFFGECLPYAAAIVHIGSTPNDFAKAKEWAQKQTLGATTDPVSVLAVLTFLYLVHKGSESKDPGKRQQWASIGRRANYFLRLGGPDANKPAEKAS